MIEYFAEAVSSQEVATKAALDSWIEEMKDFNCSLRSPVLMNNMPFLEWQDKLETLPWLQAPVAYHQPSGLPRQDTLISLSFVLSKSQLVDLFTKPLSIPSRPPFLPTLESLPFSPTHLRRDVKNTTHPSFVDDELQRRNERKEEDRSKGNKVKSLTEIFV
ncbi:hypothetical protein FXO38_34333 [Capsicum annuum]|nr:hypothetical protein FXO38_34333 [Capsicum annuum]